MVENKKNKEEKGRKAVAWIGNILTKMRIKIMINDLHQATSKKKDE